MSQTKDYESTILGNNSKMVVNKSVIGEVTGALRGASKDIRNIAKIAKDDGDLIIGDTGIKWGGDSPNGTAGNKGEQGDNGVKGDKGQRGTNGVKGDKGQPGEAGAQGDKGAAGANGPKGQPGNDATEALQGDKGAKADLGLPGLNTSVDNSTNELTISGNLEISTGNTFKIDNDHDITFNKVEIKDNKIELNRDEIPFDPKLLNYGWNKDAFQEDVNNGFLVREIGSDYVAYRGFPIVNLNRNSKGSIQLKYSGNSDSDIKRFFETDGTPGTLPSNISGATASTYGIMYKANYYTRNSQTFRRKVKLFNIRELRFYEDRFEAYTLTSTGGWAIYGNTETYDLTHPSPFGVNFTPIDIVTRAVDDPNKIYKFPFSHGASWSNDDADNQRKTDYGVDKTIGWHSSESDGNGVNNLGYAQELITAIPSYPFPPTSTTDSLALNDNASNHDYLNLLDNGTFKVRIRKRTLYYEHQIGDVSSVAERGGGDRPNNLIFYYLKYNNTGYTHWLPKQAGGYDGPVGEKHPTKEGNVFYGSNFQTVYRIHDIVIRIPRVNNNNISETWFDSSDPNTVNSNLGKWFSVTHDIQVSNNNNTLTDEVKDIIEDGSFQLVSAGPSGIAVNEQTGQSNGSSVVWNGTKWLFTDDAGTGLAPISTSSLTVDRGIKFMKPQNAQSSSGDLSIKYLPDSSGGSGDGLYLVNTIGGTDNIVSALATVPVPIEIDYNAYRVSTFQMGFNSSSNIDTQNEFYFKSDDTRTYSIVGTTAELNAGFPAGSSYSHSRTRNESIVQEIVKLTSNTGFPLVDASRVNILLKSPASGTTFASSNKRAKLDYNNSYMGANSENIMIFGINFDENRPTSNNSYWTLDGGSDGKGGQGTDWVQPIDPGFGLQDQKVPDDINSANTSLFSNSNTNNYGYENSASGINVTDLKYIRIGLHTKDTSGNRLGKSHIKKFSLYASKNPLMALLLNENNSDQYKGPGVLNEPRFDRNRDTTYDSNYDIVNGESGASEVFAQNKDQASTADNQSEKMSRIRHAISFWKKFKSGQNESNPNSIRVFYKYYDDNIDAMLNAIGSDNERMKKLIKTDSLGNPLHKDTPSASLSNYGLPGEKVNGTNVVSTVYNYPISTPWELVTKVLLPTSGRDNDAIKIVDSVRTPDNDPEFFTAPLNMTGVTDNHKYFLLVIEEIHIDTNTATSQVELVKNPPSLKFNFLTDA